MVNRKRRIIFVLLLAFGIPASLVFGQENRSLPDSEAGTSRSGPFVLAAAADATVSEKRVEKSGGRAPAAGTSEPREAPEKEPKPEKEKTPFKTFVPSERIEPDHAVDFPADI